LAIAVYGLAPGRLVYPTTIDIPYHIGRQDSSITADEQPPAVRRSKVDGVEIGMKGGLIHNIEFFAMLPRSPGKGRDLPASQSPRPLDSRGKRLYNCYANLGRRLVVGAGQGRPRGLTNNLRGENLPRLSPGA
jgi:hypothetical protein